MGGSWPFAFAPILRLGVPGREVGLEHPRRHIPFLVSIRKCFLLCIHGVTPFSIRGGVSIRNLFSDDDMHARWRRGEAFVTFFA
jgi:hypothetical protein